MNKSFVVIGLLAGVLAVGSAMGADSSDKKISQDTYQLKKDYETKVHKDLRKIDAKIDQFKRGTHRTGEDVHADVDKEVKKLEAQKADADRKLADLEKSTGDAWKDLRRGVDGAVSDLKKSVDEASRQFAKK